MKYSVIANVNSIAFNISCNTNFANVDDFNFKIILGEFDKDIKCSNVMMTFGGLSENTDYNASITINIDGATEICTYKELGLYTTGRSNQKFVVILSVTIPVLMIIIAILVVVILGKSNNEIHL